MSTSTRPLTPVEREIVDHLANGLTQEAAAKKCCITVGNLTQRLSSLRARRGARNTQEMLIRMIRDGEI